MKKTILIIPGFIVSFYACSENLVAENTESKACLNISPANYMSECLSVLKRKKEKQYISQYKIFIDDVNSKKEIIINYNDFLSGITEAKSNFESYMRNECSAYASQLVKDSPAYHSIFNQCMINFYGQRIDFYKNYDFQ